MHSKHRIYVPRGRLALVLLDVEPLMLEPGLHNFDAPRFLFKEMALATAPYLFIGSMHRIFIPAGAIAQIIDGGVGQLIETPGVQVFNSATFEFKGCLPATTPFIRVGAASRIVVAAGTLGKLTVNGSAQLLAPGVHTFTEANLTYDGAASATDVLIEYGNIKRVLVPQGTWFITYDDGALVCLPPGQHTLTKASHRVAGALSAGMSVLRHRCGRRARAAPWRRAHATPRRPALRRRARRLAARQFWCAEDRGRMGPAPRAHRARGGALRARGARSL